MQRKVLPQSFFRLGAVKTAKALLGKFLVRKIGSQKIAFVITEVEAYDGFHDKASHASKGRTERNQIMFGEPARFYVYLIYGMYWMLNIVCGPKDYPSAILIRGVEGISGPGRLTKKLKIGKSFNGKVADVKNNLWFEDRGFRVSSKSIKKTKRIGIDYAGDWAEKLYRFVLQPSWPSPA